MAKTLAILIVAALALTPVCAFAASKDSSDILKEGLLGAGSGAVGGLASGAKGGDIWKGALAGAGVNIIGGALLDNITGEKVQSESNVRGMGATDAYQEGYKDGFENGYKQGYTTGYKEGLQEQLKK